MTAIPDEFKIILEDINQKFDILIEEHSGLNNKFDQLDHKIGREIEDRQPADAALLKEIRELRTDLNEHRNNTEHGEEWMDDIYFSLKRRPNPSILSPTPIRRRAAQKVA